MKVLDASIAVDLLADSPRGVAAAALIGDERLAVPAHFDAEVYSAFRRLFRLGLIPRTRLDQTVARLLRLAAERVPLPPLLAEAHLLADQLSVPDAFYVALARMRDAELVTGDAALARAAQRFAGVRLI